MELYQKMLYFDIETAGKYKSLQDFLNDDPRGAALFIKRCEKNKEKWPDIGCDKLYLEKASLLPEYGQIICASFAYYKEEADGTIQLRRASYTGTELEILVKTLAILSNINKMNLSLCGFNIKGFDNSWLIKKFFQHNLPIPDCLNLVGKKPWELNIYDIADIWKAGYFDYPTLDEVSWALGIKSPKQFLSGDKVHKAFWDGEIDKIQKYCEADVTCLVEIAKKILK